MNTWKDGPETTLVQGLSGINMYVLISLTLQDSDEIVFVHLL